MTLHHGSCHCGAIALSLADDPTVMAVCNCSICRRSGALWYHCLPAVVTVTGEATGYVQGDCMLTTWHCGTCGCTTHWTPIDPDYERMAVNLRMFDPALQAGLPLKEIDGASY